MNYNKRLIQNFNKFNRKGLIATNGHNNFSKFNFANLAQAKQPSSNIRKGTDEFDPSINVNKSSMKHTYYKNDPLSYVQWLTPLDYGQFQDKFVEFSSNYIDRLKKSKANDANDSKIIVSDLGALYGNTSLAIINNLTWNESVSFWLSMISQNYYNHHIHANDNNNNNGNQSLAMDEYFDDDIKNKYLKDKEKWDINAVDLSKEALEFGQNSGIFDAIYVQDFNEPFSKDLAQVIENSDFLVCLMATNYMKEGQWANIVNNIFLKNRSKDKILFYNTVCAFQKHELSPEIILRDQKDIEWNKIFTKHRLFTPQESQSFNHNRESWTWLYGVYCNKIKKKKN